MRALLLMTILVTLATARAAEVGGDGPLDASFICESSESEVVITQGSACYNDCRPTRGVLGLGRTRVGLDRSNCLPCLQQHGNLYRLRSEYRSSGGAPVQANATIDASIVCQENNAEIRAGDVCYNECKPSRGPLGLGKVRIGLDRKSCLPCLQQYPDRFQLRSEFGGRSSSSASVNCSISEDQQIAVCEGRTYRLDSSISDSSRSIVEKVQGSGASSRQGGPGNSAQVNGQ